MSNMTKMVSLRKFRLPSTSGHAVIFEPNTPTDVPQPLVAEAMAAGCVPADGDGVFYEDLERTKVDFTGDVRRSMIYLAVQRVVEDNKPSEFDGSGTPNIPAIESRLGFDVTKPEILAIYREYQTYASENRAFPLHPASENILRVIDAGTKAELIDLAEEFGVDGAKAKGLTVKDLRKLLLVKFDGNVAG